MSVCEKCGDCPYHTLKSGCPANSSSDKGNRRMKPIPMWALFNFSNLFHVAHTRRDCIKAGIDALGSKREYEKYRRSGAFTVERIQVRRTRRTGA